MPSQAAKPTITPPSSDKRGRFVEATMRRNGNAPDALIETLHTVQESFGYLDDESLRYVSAALKVALSKVYGVATFYHFFSLKPQGQHSCVVCEGTACYLKGSPAILSSIDANFHVKPGGTTEDNELSILSARCLGSCGLAPAAVFDGEVHGKLTPEEAVSRIKEAINHDA